MPNTQFEYRGKKVKIFQGISGNWYIKGVMRTFWNKEDAQAWATEMISLKLI